MPEVFLSAMALLQALCPILRQVRRAEAHSSLDPLMALLVERLGDGNARGPDGCSENSAEARVDKAARREGCRNASRVL